MAIELQMAGIAMSEENVEQKRKSVADELMSLGWRKDSYLYYRYADEERRYIVSIILDKMNIDSSISSLVAMMRFHSLCLNEFSNFIEQYNCNDPEDIGIFEGFCLPLRIHLRGRGSLSLSAIDRILICGNKNASDFAEKCDIESKLMYGKYRYVDDLCVAFDSERKLFSRDSLMINLYLKRYSRVREIFSEKFSRNDKGMGYIIKYMDKYNLN